MLGGTGICERESDGTLYKYIWFPSGLPSWVMLQPIDWEDIEIDLLTCIQAGFPIDSKLLNVLPGVFDISFGFKILT